MDPNRAEVGQAWDLVDYGWGRLVIVIEVRDHTPSDMFDDVFDVMSRRNVSVYVVVDEGEYSTEYTGHVISYSEAYLRRNFRRVC
jgi:CBS domain-containing protein